MIPHQKPFLFVAGIRGAVPPSLEVWADFPRDNPYVSGPSVPRMILVEAMAQAVGVYAANEAGAPRAGVLAMLKHVRFLADAANDARVFLRVRPMRNFGRLRMFAAEAHVDGGALLASAEIVVAET